MKDDNEKSTEKHSTQKMFYTDTTGLIPSNIVSDFSEEDNFLLLFVNPRSGSQQGKIVLEYSENYKESSVRNYSIISFPIIEKNDWSFGRLTRSNSTQSFEEIRINKGIERPIEFDPDIPFSIIIFNVLDKNDYLKGKNFIKKYLEDFPDYKIKILIGGGDGTVLSVIEELNDFGICLQRCIFGALPFGTGNDLSNAMGFGCSCEIAYKPEYFQRVLYTYLTASETNIDLWELRLKVDRIEGCVNDITSRGEIIQKEKNGEIIKDFKKTFINYMSIGFDAKVGFEFEKKRSNHRLINKAIYGWEALKKIIKMIYQRYLGLSSLLESFDTFEGSFIGNNDPELDYFFEEKNLTEIELKNKIQIFKTKEALKGKKNKNIRQTRLKGNPVVIVGQNISFYGGGTENIWGSSKQIGTLVSGLKRKERKLYEENKLKSFKDQACDDRMMEFFSYDHGMDMGLDRFTGGRAKKVFQGRGPFFFTFKKNPSRRQRKTLNNVYINLDGEFFHLIQPRQISISQDMNICNGQLKILKNEIGIWRLKEKTTLQKVKKHIEYYKFSILMAILLIFYYYYGTKLAILFAFFMVFCK